MIEEMDDDDDGNNGYFHRWMMMKIEMHFIDGSAW